MKVNILLIFFLLLTGCSFNPFISNNRTTGSPMGAAAGAGVGAGSMALLGAPKSLIALGGLGGGAVGYYVTTLRYDAGGVIQAAGKVYKVGDFIGIYIPSDQLFEPNTAEFLPQAHSILDSAAAVLSRYPNNNILISGNTSGFSRPRWELRISEERAKKVSAYLWDSGLSQFRERSIDMRNLNYVGYGDYFPIAHTYTNESLRENSRIQITSYPSSCDFGMPEKELATDNIGTLNNEKFSRSLSDCLERENDRPKDFKGEVEE